MNNVCIIIPVYNEGNHLESLLNEIKKLYNMDIIVIDDGSTDKSISIANRYAKQCIVHKKNKGKGMSILDGIIFAKKIYKYAILMDGDGQHLPSDIEKFLKKKDRYDIIVGKRNMNKSNMPLLRYFINRITTLIVSIFAGQQIYDSQSGFRLVNIEKFFRIKIKTFRFQMESEMLIKSGRLGYRIGFVPIETIYGDEVSKINPIIDTLRFIKLILEEFWY